jgi:hypothetical protein
MGDLMTVAGRRASSIAGIVFVALFVVGVLMSLDSPDVGDLSPSQADQKILTYLSSSSHRVQHVVGAYVLIVAAVFFVWFCLGLRARLEAVAPANATPGRLVAALSAVGATLMVAAGMTSAVVAGDVSGGGNPLPVDGDAARVVMSLTYPLLFVAFAIIAAAIIATSSVVALRSGALPRWLAYAGWLAVLGGIVSVAFLPMALPMLWFLAVAIIGLTSQPRMETATSG